jgi:hypothetical protein
MAAQTQILAAVISETVFARFAPLVSRSDLSLTRARSGQHALVLAHQLSYDLVIGQHPLTDIGFDEFHSHLRSADCASRRAALLILTREDRLDALTEHLDDDAAQVICIDLAPEQVEKALNEILGVAIRASSRLLVETSLDCKSMTYDRIFQTVDISESGLLFRSSSPLPIGSRMKFALSLPDYDEPVRGLAEVVRHTRPAREKATGAAIRFLQLDGEGRTQLADFIDRQLSSSRAAGLAREH